MERYYTQRLFEYLELFPCVAILGVRQCGKTTLLKELPRGWKIYDLEKGSDYQLASRDPDLFFRLNKERVAIDECQLLPELFPALRVAIDNEREKCGRFIITGSSSPDLLKSISESLAGRIAILELAPFSQSEAFARPRSNFFNLIADGAPVSDLTESLENAIDISDTHAHWVRGGYPEPWVRNKPRHHRLWMQNYIRTYLNRDILRLFPGLNTQKYRLFLQMLSNLSGNIINYSNVSRALGISQPTARDYFQIADGTFIWRSVPSYEKNAVKRVVKHPKGYLRDSGLLHSMLHIYDLDRLLVHPSMDSSWEGMVIENILRGFNSLGVQYDYYYYRTGAGAEVDLVLEGEFGLLPVEIKYEQTVSPRELRGIRDFIKERGCRYGVVINNNDKATLYNDNLLGVPFGAL